jgi:hypothetical protein
METRIKYIKRKNSWYYAVHVKRWIFCKTIYTDSIFANVEKFIDTLGQIDDFNSKTKSWFNAMVKSFMVRMNCNLEPLNNENIPNIKMFYLDF